MPGACFSGHYWGLEGVRLTDRSARLRGRQTQFESDYSPEKYPPHHGIIRDEVQSRRKRVVAGRIFPPHTLHHQRYLLLLRKKVSEGARSLGWLTFLDARREL
ncbi:hypothetical protein ABVK25_002634 [Lepraria finkii]|uniref:Uncharacterized protein n=1 Tax=Lepraria finkii TaxID=1340010 RepID=A0ABR4BGV9_9LECA